MPSTKSRKTPRQQSETNGNGHTAAASPVVDILPPLLDQLPSTLPKVGIVARVPRNSINFAAYNPNKHDPYSFDGLKQNIQRTEGLVERPVWNRKTGNLVAGHHRIKAEDKRKGNQEYVAEVVVVDWDERFEREQNIALNNDNIRGRIDFDMFRGLAESPDIDIFATGHDTTSLESLYQQNGETIDWKLIGGAAGIPQEMEGNESESGREATPEQVERVAAADEVAEQIEEADAAKAREKEEKKQEQIRAIKDRRQEYKAEVAFRCDVDVSLTLISPTSKLVAAFLRFLQKPENSERLDLVQLVTFLELDIPEFHEFREGRMASENATETTASIAPQGAEGSSDNGREFEIDIGPDIGPDIGDSPGNNRVNPDNTI